MISIILNKTIILLMLSFSSLNEEFIFFSKFSIYSNILLILFPSSSAFGILVFALSRSSHGMFLFFIKINIWKYKNQKINRDYIFICKMIHRVTEFRFILLVINFEYALLTHKSFYFSKNLDAVRTCDKFLTFSKFLLVLSLYLIIKRH